MNELVSVSPSEHSLMFEIKAGAYLFDAHTIDYAPEAVFVTLL